MNHSMKLLSEPFEKIKSGRKTVEIRIFDEKRSQLQIGDVIVFTKLPGKTESLSCKILNLFKYHTFEELVQAHNMIDFGYSEDFDKKEFLKSIYTIYTTEQEQKYGVLGIKLQVIKDV